MKIFEFIEDNKWAVLGTVLVHVIWFFAFNFTYVSRPSFPEEEEVEITMPLEQIEFEDLSVQEKDEDGNITKSGEIKNMVINQGDDREKSMDNYSKNNLDKQVEEELKELERQTMEEAQGDREGIYESTVEDEMMNATDEELEELAKKYLNKESGGSKDKIYGGRTMVSFDIPERTAFNNELKYVRNPGYTCNGSGSVVVRVKLDRDGKVIQAKYAPELSYKASSCMIEQAEKFAKLSRFNFDANGDGQTGTITYEFIAQ